MRTDLSTIQQTLTPEAAIVLSQSIEEATRRRHGQTTPLHVAASLLSSPTSIFRRACASASSNSPHPLQCRALELCFSVALDRIPSSSSVPNTCPPISNALMAALKRAQAHQRRGGSGCPDSPQPPLLAVKVELEQLVLSILDDPSVSRVMREASFNSSAVKTIIENSVVSTSSNTSNSSSSPVQLGIPQSAIIPSAIPSLVQNPNLNLNLNSNKSSLYINPRLANVVSARPIEGQKRVEDVKRVFDIMLRSNNRNPILVGDCDQELILKEVLLKISSGQAPLPVKSALVLNFDQYLSKIGELGVMIEDNLKVANAIVINLGDLKWLVEGPVPTMGPTARGAPVVTEAGRSAVSEISRLLVRFNGETETKVWLLGTAACATYLRCQVYHPNMETDWDLQVVPIAAPQQQSMPPSLINPRLVANGGILNNSLSAISPTKGVGFGIRPVPSAGVIPLRQSPQIVLGNTNLSNRGMCHTCTTSYEREREKLVMERFERSSSATPTNVPKPDSGQNLPHWLQLSTGQISKYGSTDNRVQAKDQELIWKNRTEELHKKWHETCARFHPTKPNIGQSTLAIPSGIPSVLSPTTPPNLKLTAGNVSKIMPQLKVPSNSEKPTLTSRLCDSNEKPKSPPGSPVKTDLSLGSTKFSEPLSDQQKAKIAGIADIDSFKKLLKDLKEKVPLQPNAASAIAAVVIQCRAGNNKQRSFMPRGDTWLLFVGADKIGKRKMATALSESLFGAGPTIVRFSSGDRVEPKKDLWGKTSLDRVVEVVRMNPFAVILIEDIDCADAVVRGKIKRAIERGRLPDTHGREVNLGNVTFILTTSWIPGEIDMTHETLIRYEERILDLADSGSWQLELSSSYVDESVKHRADWLCDDDRPCKTRKGGSVLSLDLNLAISSSVDDTCEGSHNSSDLTVEHEPYDKSRHAVRSLMPSPILELIELVEESILFEPIDFGPLKTRVLESVTSKIVEILGDNCSIWVDDEVIDRLVSGVWVQGAEIKDWTEKVLRHSIQQMKHNSRPCARKLAVRLSTSVCYASKDGGGLPSHVVMAVGAK